MGQKKIRQIKPHCVPSSSTCSLDFLPCFWGYLFFRDKLSLNSWVDFCQRRSATWDHSLHTGVFTNGDEIVSFFLRLSFPLLLVWNDLTVIFQLSLQQQQMLTILNMNLEPGLFMFHSLYGMVFADIVCVLYNFKGTLHRLRRSV